MARTREQLRRFQKRAVPFMAKRKCAALFADMGTGKTACGLYTILKLFKENRARRILIVAPANVIKTVWRQEAREWIETRKLKFSVIVGTEDQRIVAVNTKADVYLISPDNFVWLLLLLDANEKRGAFDTLIIDESSKFKAHNTQRFKTIRKYAGDFRQKYILTGTPTPNSLLELWPQFYILDQGDRLGTSFTNFRNLYFTKEHPRSYKYIPHEWTIDIIEKKIGDITFRLDAEDWLDMPRLIYDPIFVELPPTVRKYYDVLEKEMVIKLKELLAKKMTISAVNVGALINKCQQMANGACYLTDDRDLPSREWRQFHNEKLDALEDALDQISAPTIVAYKYQHDLARLKERFPDIPHIGSKTKDIEKLVLAWNNNRYPFVFMHCSSGHGLNLHKGGARHVVFFSLTYSRESFDQLIARVGPARRTGQKEPTMVYPIITKNTVDEHMIWPTLTFKGKQQKNLLDHLREYTIKKHGLKI